MSGTLDTWLSGSPVVALGPRSGDFGSWLDGEPVVRLGAVQLEVLDDEVLFTGEIVQVSVRGRILTARCRPGGSIFDRQVARFRIQTGCNHTLFDAGCGLSKATWKFTATVADPGAPGFPFEFELSDLQRASGLAPTYFEHWFAGGWIEFGTGTTWCRRPILRSSTVTGGSLTVTLSRDPSPFPQAGDPVVLYPGCDGRFETCGEWHATNNPAGKFDNRLNFGGHPFVPVANPSLAKVSETVGGGKKG